MVVSPALAWLLAGVFVWAGTLNIVGPAFVEAEFAKWGYPPVMRLGIGLIELIAGALLLDARTHVFGACLAMVVLIGVMFSFARTKEWLRLEYPIVLFVIALITAAL
jgi:hypothetical protein